MIESSYKSQARVIAKTALDQLERSRRAERLSQDQLSELIDVTRQTVADRLKRGDMRLSDFVASALAVGTKPHELLRLAEVNTSSFMQKEEDHE